MIYTTVRVVIDGPSRLAMLAVVAFTVLWTTFSCRMFKRGIYVSGLGVRTQEFFSSRTFLWESIHKFRILHTDPIHFSEEVLIVLRDGSTVPTPVRFPDDPDVTPENVVKQYWAGPTVCRMAVERLMKELAQAQSRAGHDS
ncbi:hypothetical protein [Actinokineospora xionganensis]|uniref:PH domain-containing protein n=1 Tax=Actinokineospora xionganensis TaxID=2684470 RepID=A0ABR7L5G0_9PSEU|nr:hypothetical protein [Actinokineospora xionganensis]MBC6447837.1 hypothetical protein [Actinokineospora xionganensis]